MTRRGKTFADLVPDANAVDPLAGIEHEQALEEVRAAVACLPPKLATVIRARFWTERTLKEIGKSELGGVSRERARQLEVEALDALRRAMGAAARRKAA